MLHGPAVTALVLLIVLSEIGCDSPSSQQSASLKRPSVPVAPGPGDPVDLPILGVIAPSDLVDGAFGQERPPADDQYPIAELFRLGQLVGGDHVRLFRRRCAPLARVQARSATKFRALRERLY